MTESKWTKGPWSVLRTRPNCFLQHIVSDEKDAVLKTVAEVYCGGLEQDKANANLIAAAPDLAEACEAVLSQARPTPYRQGEGTQFFVDIPSSTLETLRAALRKAKGEV